MLVIQIFNTLVLTPNNYSFSLTFCFCLPSVHLLKFHYWCRALIVRRREYYLALISKLLEIIIIALLLDGNTINCCSFDNRRSSSLHRTRSLARCLPHKRGGRCLLRVRGQGPPQGLQSHLETRGEMSLLQSLYIPKGWLIYMKNCYATLHYCSKNW